MDDSQTPPVSAEEHNRITMRVSMMIDYLLALPTHPNARVRVFTDAEKATLEDFRKVSVQNAALIQNIEQKLNETNPGDNKIAAVAHHLKKVLSGSSLHDVVTSKEYSIWQEEDS